VIGDVFLEQVIGDVFWEQVDSHVGPWATHTNIFSYDLIPNLLGYGGKS
jgi:hypothetical protein